MENNIRGLGLEPRFTASKAGVLPLDDPREASIHQIGQPDYIVKYEKEVFLIYLLTVQ